MPERDDMPVGAQSDFGLPVAGSDQKFRRERKELDMHRGVVHPVHKVGHGGTG
jgi:hypothetical protein